MGDNMLGKIINYNTKNNKITVNFENQKLNIIFINEDIVRFFIDFTNENFSFAVKYQNKNSVNYSIDKVDEYIQIKSKKLIINVFDNFKIDIYDSKGNIIAKDYKDEIKYKISPSSALAELEGHKTNENVDLLKLLVAKELKEDDYIYGLGDKSNYLNKRHYDYINWCSDLPQTHTENFKSLYKDIPFFIVKGNKKTYGIFFDNTFKTYFDMGFSDEKYLFFGANEGNLDYYFINGKNIKEVIKNYTLLTGRTPLPQMWTLGHHQSRWSYFTSKEAREIVNKYRELNIPLDAIHLDINYMERYKVFSINKETYPDFDEMVNDFNNVGVKVVTIIDPGVKIEKGYNIYEEGIENNYFALRDDKVYENAVWPGDSVFPNFLNSKVRKWWGDNSKFLLEHGIRGIWTDMNEPASFKGALPDDVVFKADNRDYLHKEAHNVYGSCMAEATYNGLKEHDKRRPFVITRACYAGVQKHSTVWTGDNQSIWPHLEMAIPQLCNMGMSGLVFSGTDIGGFGTNTHKELLIRWLEASIFTPLFRNHCEVGSIHQEPWCFDKETIDIYRKFVNLRYEFIPYIYDLFFEQLINGLPILRPLVMEYQNDKNTFELNDEFMVGENILVAPIVKQGATKRMIYLPKGEWIDYFTNKIYQGNQYIVVNAPLDSLPLFIKNNSIIVKYPLKQYIEESDTLVLNVYGKNGVYIHYQDDGESFNYEDGEFNLYYIENSNNQLSISLDNHGYNKTYKFIKIIKKKKEILLPFIDGIKINLNKI